MEKLTLKKQYIIYFALIITLSLGATIIHGVISYVIYANIQYKWTKPANYYEQQIPSIKKMIKSRGTVLLKISKKQYMEKKIPAKGIKYQVFDQNGNYIYGTYKDRVVKSKKELYDSINIDNINWNYVRSIIPLIDKNGTIRGGVFLAYRVKATYSNGFHRIIIMAMAGLLLLSPFIYIIIFTLIFSRRFVRGINKPISLLKEASHKIRENDLDFSIDYDYKNELGELCRDFEDMKTALQLSLVAQWKAEQERQENVQALAHDLKTPLSIIQGYTEALLNGNLENKEKTERYLKVVNENSIKSSNVVREMQYASEIDSEKMTVQKEELDIEKFLNKKAENYRILSASKNITIELGVKKADKVLSKYRVDKEKLDRILDNIVTNSIRYTPSNGIINIELKLERKCMEFQVYNSGEAFTEEELKNVFSRFYRADKARSSKDGHAGLGLYIVKKLVEFQGGSIEAKNTEENRACISFVLYDM